MSVPAAPACFDDPPADAAAHDALVLTVRRQVYAMVRGEPVGCPCGERFEQQYARLLDRCFHCRLWFCRPCAERHFGPRPAVWRGSEELRKARVCTTGDKP